MKKILAVLFTVLTIGNLTIAPVHADEAGEKKEKIIEMLQLMGSMNMVDQMITKMEPVLRKELENSPQNIKDQDIEIIVGFVIDLLRSNQDGLMEKMVPIYEQNLTIAELDASIAFYSTPEGQSLLRKMPVLFQQGMLAGQQWGQEVFAKAMKQMQEKIKSMGYKT